MEERSIYRNLSPLDHRYLLSNRDTFERLSDYLSEVGSVRYCVQVECALLAEYLERFLSGDEALKGCIAALPAQIDPEEVYAEPPTARSEG